MRPRTTSRALTATVVAVIAALFPTVAVAAEYAFALPTSGREASATSARQTPFEISGPEPKPVITSRIIEAPPFDFPTAEPVASCRGCVLRPWFEPPPFVL